MKKLGITLLCVAIIALIGVKSFDQPTDRDVEYYREINALLKNADFSTARLHEGVITLYDAALTPIEEITFDSYDPQIPLVSIRKNENSIHFIPGGSADDEYGIVFMNEGSDQILDGIVSPERIGGNSYIYSTR